MADDDLRFPEPTDEDIARVNRTLGAIGGKSTVWDAHHIFEVLRVEHQLRAEKMATDRLQMVSWILAGATIALVVATAGLIIATLAASAPLFTPASLAEVDAMHKDALEAVERWTEALRGVDHPLSG